MNKAIVIEEGVLTGVIKSEGSLSGVIQSEGSLSGTIESDGILEGSLLMPTGYDNYVGPYEMTPKVTSQTLDTADKHLTDDVTIEAIPYYEVSNSHNGKTIIIGGNNNG